MIERTITLGRDKYDPFIDYLKAYAIICVVISHALPAELHLPTLFTIYGDMQVPLFIMIQVFHAYKKGKPNINIRKLWERIFKPFFGVQFLIISLYFTILYFRDSLTIEGELINVITGGGKGPGSYYPWIYLQMAIMLPLVWKIIQRYTTKQLLIPFVLVCIGFDVLLSIFNCPEWLYRLLTIRYIFLIWIGVMWVRSGIKVNVMTIILSLFAIIITLFFALTTYDLEPFFFNTEWKTHRWPCYFYVALLLPIFIWCMNKRIVKISWLDRFIRRIGSSSYEIFLVQMGVFLFIPVIIERNLISSPYLFYSFLFLIEVILSIGLGIFFRSCLDNRRCCQSKSK